MAQFSYVYREAGRGPGALSWGGGGSEMEGLTAVLCVCAGSASGKSIGFGDASQPSRGGGKHGRGCGTRAGHSQAGGSTSLWPCLWPWLRSIQVPDQTQQHPRQLTWCQGATPLLAELQKQHPASAEALADSFLFGDRIYFQGGWVRQWRRGLCRHCRAST